MYKKIYYIILTILNIKMKNQPDLHISNVYK